MNSTPTSKLLTIVSPTPTTPVVPSVDSREFDRYFHKAASPVTSAEKPARKPELEVSQSEPAPERETIESSGQEQAASSEDHSGTENTANEQPVASSDKQPASEQSDDDQDEVVLSEAAVALQAEKPTQQEVNTENGEVENDSTSSDQKPKQSDSKASLDADTAETNLAGEQEEGADLKQVNAEKAPAAKGESQESTEQVPKSPAEEKTEQSERNSPNRSGEGSASTGPRQKARFERNSGEQSESPQEALPLVEKSKPEIGTTIQSLTPVVSDATESSPATANSNPSTPTVAQNSSHASVLPTANHNRTETSSPQAGSETAVPTVDRGRFVQRVANAFRSAQQSDGEIQLRLSPPELGSLKMEIAVRHGVLTAKLEAENVDARNTLLDNLPALRQRLAEQEIRIEKFDVDIRRDGGQSQTGTEDRQSRDGTNRENTNQGKQKATESVVTTSRVPRSVLNHKPDSLDVRI